VFEQMSYQEDVEALQQEWEEVSKLNEDLNKEIVEKTNEHKEFIGRLAYSFYEI
jgi:hypothetical protein